MRRHQRIWVLMIGALVVLLAAAAIAGPRIYAAFQPPAKAPLSIQESPGLAAPDPSVQSVGPSADLDGAWRVTQGSQAGYRVKEVLNGESITVVGRTGDVRGDISVSGGRITSGVVRVRVAGIATDDASRDAYFRDKVMNVAANPSATFTLKTPFAVPDFRAGSVKLVASGSLALVGTTREVPANLTVARQSGGGVSVSGTISIKASDFGLTAPSLGFVSVEDTVVVEFLIHLEK